MSPITSAVLNAPVHGTELAQAAPRSKFRLSMSLKTRPFLSTVSIVVTTT